MTNMIDYLMWRGDIPISREYPINEVDSLILARLSYFPFDKIDLKPKETIESVSKKSLNVEDKYFSHKSEKELIKELIKAPRFKDLIITDYVHNSDKITEKQFGAVAIHLPKGEIYISYVGTDNTINGWKEDFNMAFMDNVPCQLSGLEYLKHISIKYPTKKIILGGHSKGGNIALYTFVSAPKITQYRIKEVYNFDGPGLNSTIWDKYYNTTLLNKIKTYIPQESIIGRLLIHKEKIIICESREKGIMQHDICSWHVLKDKLIKLDKTTKASEYINDAVENWLKETTIEERKIFIDTIFEILNSSEVDSFIEILSSITITAPKILRKYKELSEEEKKTMSEMMKKFITSYFNTLTKRKK